MKILLDTNVLMDVVANRQPWVEDALVLFELANQKKITLVATDCSFVNITYINRKLFAKEELYSLLEELREFVHVIEMGEAVIDDAIRSRWNDFEDCAQYYAAKCEKVDYIITRNEKDFSASDIPVLSPHSFLLKYL